MRRTFAIVAATALVGIAAAVGAQQQGFSRTLLQQVDISVPGREVVTALAVFQPGGSVGQHTHPGEEVGYVIEGTFLLEVAGKPAVTVETGKAFVIPPNTVHNATNKGTAVGRILANYIVEKGKPTATPVPAPAATPAAAPAAPAKK